MLIPLPSVMDSKSSTVQTKLSNEPYINPIAFHQSTHNQKPEVRTTKKMKASIKYLFVLGFLAIVGFHSAYGAGECPKSTPDAEAMKLYPCADAAQDAKAPPSPSCCAQVKRLGQNPKCLCAVMLSNTAKSSGVNPEIALTIPKRCNFANRPVGYKCGPYTLP